MYFLENGERRTWRALEASVSKKSPKDVNLYVIDVRDYYVVFWFRDVLHKYIKEHFTSASAQMVCEKEKI
jgi:hypothetical protein